MKHRFLAALVASAVCAGVVAVSPVGFNASADEKAGVRYTETDLFRFILNGTGPIAQDKPRLADEANIGRLGIPDESIAKAEAAYEQVDPGFGANLVAEMQSGDPYRVADVLQRMNADTQKIRQEKQGAPDAPLSTQDVTTNVNNVFNYNVEAISAVTTVFFVAEAVVAAVLVLIKVSDQKGDLAHDKDVETLAIGLAG
jgi:SdpC family antimicrobial peptide